MFVFSLVQINGTYDIFRLFLCIPAISANILTANKRSVTRSILEVLAIWNEVLYSYTKYSVFVYLFIIHIAIQILHETWPTSIWY